MPNRRGARGELHEGEASRNETAYSVFRHLGSALWLTHDPCRSYFMVYNAYYDASSKEEVVSAPLVVAGIAANEAKWIQFESDWKRVLDTYGVEFLEMAACAQWFGRPYNTWERSEKLRAPFLAGLAEALTNATKQIVIVRIIPADFHAVNARYRLGSEQVPSAYPIAAIKCMALMEEMIASDSETRGIGHIVERGDTGQGALVALQVKGWPITVQPKQDPRTKEWFHPFGACDLVAYEYRKAIETKLAKGTHRFPFRGLLRALQKIPTRKVYISREDLTAMCEAKPDSYPRRDQ